VRDITERKQAEEALRQKTDELEHFAYVASHDLKEPLRKISSFTGLLASRYKGRLDEKADNYIWYIVDGAIRMEKLIEDLLTYSRLGRAELTLETISAESSVKQAMSDLEQFLTENDAEVTYAELPVIQVNPVQFEQLVRNLIHNAVKFRTEDKPCVHISAERKDDCWVFSVADNGIGIDPEQSERIFGIFQRLHNRDKYSGTGIGLAVAKKVVERHGGRIWVESSPGKGSVFYFTVPER
jgi:light-regulated signal transduction histidine kinase (bacteriophytochrome)